MTEYPPIRESWDEEATRWLISCTGVKGITPELACAICHATKIARDSGEAYVGTAHVLEAIEALKTSSVK